MSEDEAHQLIGHIEKAVRQVASDPLMRGIADLIDQWKADVEAGRPIERKLSVRRSPDLDGSIETSRSRSTTRGDFVGKEDYTTFEQLDMLVASLYLAFLASSTMSKRLLDTIEEFSDWQGHREKSDPTVDLLGVESSDASRISLHISRESIAQSNKATEQLAILLNEIIQEAELTPKRIVGGEEIA